MARPKYEVLQKCFIAPHTLHPGSIITMTGEPADHLKPLNEEAEAAMELWYTKTYEHIDERTGQRVKHQPNLLKRPSVRDSAERAVVQLHSAPSPHSRGEAIDLIDRPLQPDLELTSEEEDAQAESFDGEMVVEVAAKEKKAS